MQGDTRCAPQKTQELNKKNASEIDSRKHVLSNDETADILYQHRKCKPLYICYWNKKFTRATKTPP